MKQPKKSPSLAIAATDASKTEGDAGSTLFTFTVTRSGNTTGASSATYTVTGSGSNAANAVDFTGAALPTGTVSFAAGETSKLVTINVAGDTTAEANEGFTVTLSAPSAGTTIATAAASGTIVNDDASPSLAIAATDASKAEGNASSTPFTFTVTRSGNTTGASSATYTVTGSGSNAANAVDFTGAALPTGTVSFAAGETSKLVTINVAGDTTAEANEGFTVTLSAPSAGTTIATAAASGTIVNDDASPSLAIAATDASKAEGNASSTPFTFTVTRSGNTTGASSATYTVTGSGSNAANAVDFTGAALPTGTVSFAAGETSKLVTINVAGDTTAEANEGFTVTLSAPSAGTTIATAAASGTIVNDDASPSLAIAATAASKAEGNAGSTPFTFTVTRSGNTTGASSATYTVTGSGSNAANAVDFTGAALPTGTVSFAAGETSKLVTINVAGDTTAEANEGFTVTLSAPSAGTTIATAAASGTILNDDAASGLVKAINVGGQQFTAANGITYLADPGPTTGASNISSTSADIIGTNDDPLYNTERWAQGGSYTYEIPVANGTYRVELNFAEIYSGITGAGQRVFDMSLENQPLSSLQNIDIYGKVGANAPLVIEQLVTVTDGSLSIKVGPGSDSSGNVENAKLSAFSVFSAPPETLVKAINVGGQQFTAANGITYLADPGPTTGASNISSTSADIIGTNDDPLYNTERWAQGGSYTYEIPVANGTYRVELNFAEIYSGITGAGQRVFDMSLENQPLSSLQNIDIYGKVGANAPLVIEQLVTVTDGSLSIKVGPGSDSSGNVENAKLSAFSVFSESFESLESAKLQITPGGAVNASTFNSPSFVLTNTGTTAITSFTIDLHNSLIAGNVFDPFGTFGDTTALDFTPSDSNPVTATWAFSPTVVTEGGYKTLTVNLNGAGLAAGQTFSFRVDVDPASINGPSPGPNEAGSISGFEQLGASITVGYADASSQTAEVFTDGSAGGGQAVIRTGLLPAVSLKISSAAGTPLVTDQVGGILKANLPGLNTIAGVAGTDVIVEVTGTPNQHVRLSLAEIGGVGLDIPLGSHEGNTVLQNPTVIDATIGSDGTVSVPIALPPVTSTAGLVAGSVSGLFAVTGALVNTATGEATSFVSPTLVVKDAANGFISEAGADTFNFRQGFVTTDVFNFTATGANHDIIELDQSLFPGLNVAQMLASGALTAGAGAGDVNITTSSGALIKLHDNSGNLTVATLQAHPEDFQFTGTFAPAFSSQEVISGIANPTSLQFGPDGRLYVSQQNGIIQVYTITQSTSGTWAATPSETINLIHNIPNHNDDGSLNTSVTDRQVTAILVTGTAANPVLYVTSSDPRISTDTDSGLDTNSGILSQLTWTGTAWTKVDLIRGLPRSEENHSPNGLALSADGTKLYLVDGGNTNNGAPSSYFSNTSEYALSSAVLEIDLVALNAIPNKTFTYSPGVTSTYKYDLPTLDDPTVPNDGLPGHETAGGLDVSGPFGGNNGFNQAILPANAPLRIFATGLRNAFDIVVTQAGKIYTIDNGSNDALGGTPIFVNGKPTNLLNNGGIGDNDTLNLLVAGAYYGHPVPNRANPTGSVIDYLHNITLANAASAVPAGAGVQAGFLIDPSKFTSDATRLALEGQYGAGTGPLAQFFASTNGLTEYTATAFNSAMTGDLVTASFDGTIKRIDLAADGTTVLGVTTLATPGGTPLDVTQGPGGSLWVTQIGSGQVLALTPSSTSTTFDPDIDHDGILNVADPFQYDSSNGTTTILPSNGNLVWNFQFGAGNSTPGPSGVFLGLTGHMQNGTRDFLAPVASGGLDLNNVKIGTAAGGGLVVVEKVSNGTATGSANTGEYVFQTGIHVAPDVDTLNIKWTAVNPFPGLAGIHDGQQIGGFIGTGDQDNFLKLAVGPNGTNEVLFQLESNGVTIASQALNADDLLTAAAGSSLVFNLAINRATSQAIPSVTYAGTSGPTTVTGAPISLAGTSILSAINGQYTVQGHTSELAVGLWSTNAGGGGQNTFQAAFDDIQVTSTGAAETLVKAINVGGQQFTAANGITYLADPGPTTGASNISSTSADIVGTNDDPLYNTERWAQGGSYTYEIPVANGTYRVELNFAEIYGGITGAGQRVFDMSLENQALSSLQNIDIYGQVGANAPLVIEQLVTVTDGSLSIKVGPGSDSPGNVENAKLSALSVFSVSNTLAPAGVAGNPINLALTDPSADRFGAVSLIVAGVPSGWTLSEGTNNGDGSWTIQTNDINSLSITSPETYAGALTLHVTENWIGADGGIGVRMVTVNVEAYQPGAPIFAWSGDDNLTGASGHDLFVFAQPIGHDTIYNFDPAADRIDLVGYSGFASFTDIQAHTVNDAAGNAVITIGTGESITVMGINAASLTAGDFVFNQELVTNNAGTMTVSDGALLPFSGTIVNTGTIALDSTGNKTDLQLIKHGITLQGGGQLTLSDSSENVIVGTNADVTLTNVDNVVSGAGQLGNGQLTLINEGTITANGTNSLIVDTGSNPVNNSGTLEATGGGGLIIDSDVVNSGAIWANGGNVTIEGSVTGSGTATISGNATLEFGAASAENTIFTAGTIGTLQLDQSSSFTGTVFGFANGDTLDFADIGFASGTTLTYSVNNDGTGGALTLSDGSHIANINLAGQYAAAAFQITSDTGAGTLVTYGPPLDGPVEATSGASLIAGQSSTGILQTPTCATHGGSDAFVFKPNFDHPRDHEFQTGVRYHCDQSHSLTVIQHLLDATHDVSGHAVIAADANNTIALDNVLETQLLQHPSDFHLV